MQNPALKHSHDHFCTSHRTSLGFFSAQAVSEKTEKPSAPQKEHSYL